MSHDMEFGIQGTTREFCRIAYDRVISSYPSFDCLGGTLAWLVQPRGGRMFPGYEGKWFELSYNELPLISCGPGTRE
jgi:hypothetical protein